MRDADETLSGVGTGITKARRRIRPPSRSRTARRLAHAARNPAHPSAQRGGRAVEYDALTRGDGHLGRQAGLPRDVSHVGEACHAPRVHVGRHDGAGLPDAAGIGLADGQAARPEAIRRAGAILSACFGGRIGAVASASCRASPPPAATTGSSARDGDASPERPTRSPLRQPLGCPARAGSSRKQAVVCGSSAT